MGGPDRQHQPGTSPAPGDLSPSAVVGTPSSAGTCDKSTDRCALTAALSLAVSHLSPPFKPLVVRLRGLPAHCSLLCPPACCIGALPMGFLPFPDMTFLFPVYPSTPLERCKQM